MKKVLAVAVVMAMLASSAAAVPFYIDRFRHGPYDLDVDATVPPAAPASDTVSPVPSGATILGNLRNVTLRDVSGASTTQEASSAVDTAIGTLFYDNDTSVTSELELMYGGASNLLNADFSVESVIDVFLETLDVGVPGNPPVDITLELTSGMTAGDAASGASHAVTQPATIAGDFTFSLSAFSAAGVTLTDIDRVRILFDVGGPDADLSSKLITVGIIPEPATVAVLGIGLVALARRRRRRR